MAPAPDAPDPQTAKRLAMITERETRAIEKASKARAEVEARAKAIETEWSPRVKAAEDFQALQAKAAKARGNPALVVDLFRALGYTDAHLAPIAQALYAHSPEGQADPARKAQAERLLQQRAESDELVATQKRLDELEQRLEGKDRQVTFESQKGAYIDHAMGAIDAADAGPIVKAALARATAPARGSESDTPEARAAAARNMAKLRAKLWATTEAMIEELDGDVPEPAEVIARYEETRGAELDELGIPRPTAKTTPKPNAQPAEKQNPARTLSDDLVAPRVPRPSSSGKDHRRETAALVASGKFD